MPGRCMADALSTAGKVLDTGIAARSGRERLVWIASLMSPFGNGS